MFTAERLVLKYRRFFRVAVPTIVAVDTVRSVLVVVKLAQERLKEWDEEQQCELFDSTKDLLERVVVSCQAKERDFWPKEISKAVGVSTGISTHNNPKKYIIKSPEETVAGQSASPPASRSDKQEVIIEGSRGPGPFVIEYVTWGDVWSHASQTIVHAIHCSMTNVLYQGGRLSLVKAGGSFCQQWSDCMLNASDAVNEWCRAKIPWPQCTLSRRSALRWSIDYQGVSWPNALTKAQPPLELDLTAY